MHPSRAIVAAALSIAQPAAVWSQPADRATFSVGTATASRGRTATGTIEVPAGSDAALSIPVAVVHGTRPGPVLALVAGSHGTEYASIIALEQLIATLDAAAISGTVIIVPLVNVPSFTRIVPHLNPVDGKNMNRMYPGRADGTQTDRASWAITTEVIEPSDHVIDYHGGDLDENLRPYAYWNRTGRAAQAAASRALVLAFGLDHIVISSDRPTDPAASRYLENTATTRGKPSITVEAGHSGTVEPDDVAVLVQGTLSVMRHLKMLPGAPVPVEHPVWIDHLADVASDHAGIFYPLVKPGTYVAAGMKVGHVTDFVGRTIGDLHAREAGVLLYVRALPTVARGDTVASVGVVGRAP
jgi:predicted deacylase